MEVHAAMAEAGRVVLIANDNPAHRYIAARTLRHANFTTIETGWGREAVEQARKLRPDIIVLDMHMPDQSGMMTLQQLRADSCTASIPVVFLTASAHCPLDKRQAEELGVYAYLFNPVQPDTLVSVVEGSIMRARVPKAG
jgi:CheY-like chemotaxis protein